MINVYNCLTSAFVMYAAVFLPLVNFDYYPTHICLPLNPPEVFVSFYN